MGDLYGLKTLTLEWHTIIFISSLQKPQIGYKLKYVRILKANNLGQKEEGLHIMIFRWSHSVIDSSYVTFTLKFIESDFCFTSNIQENAT